MTEVLRGLDELLGAEKAPSGPQKAVAGTRKGGVRQKGNGGSGSRTK